MDLISFEGLCISNKLEFIYSGYFGSQFYRFMLDVKGVEKVFKYFIICFCKNDNK